MDHHHPPAQTSILIVFVAIANTSDWFVTFCVMNGHLAFCLAVRINLSIDTIIIVFYNELKLKDH